MGMFIQSADWENNAPHLTDQARKDLFDSIPLYQRDARTKGIPQLGAGLIYPIADDDILVDPFPIPDHFFRGYTLDVGWNRTAAIWRAKDPETGISYFYDEHYRSEASPEIHGAAIRKRGSWIPGKVDPAARGRSQTDGLKMLTLYRKAIYGEEDLALGIRMLTIANNAVESGIYTMLMAFQQGTLKVFRNRCPGFMKERRLYRRDEKGRIIKKFDHAMDAGRYNIASGDTWLAQTPAPETPSSGYDRFTSGMRAHAHPLAWMGN